MSKNNYLSVSGTVLVQYKNTELKHIKIFNDDVVEYDGLKHDVTMYEENFNVKYFNRIGKWQLLNIRFKQIHTDIKQFLKSSMKMVFGKASKK